MATNHFFRNNSTSNLNQQNLLEDLICQAVKIGGCDIYYIPREYETEFSNFLGELPDTRFTNAYPIEVYILNFDGYDGDNEFMSKFGLEIRSSTNLVMTSRSFKRHVGLSSGLERPREGDLLYIPVFERLFEIKHADPDVNYHQMGRKASRPYYWELRVEQFKYSQENIDTGYSDIDLIGVLNSYTIQLNLGAGSGNYVIGEEVYQGNTYLTSTSTARVSDWNPTNKILSIIDIKGSMNSNTYVVGTVSGTSYLVNNYDDLEDHVPDDISDNLVLNDDAMVMITQTETNPLANTTPYEPLSDGLMDGNDDFLVPD
jgi:Virus neck protein